VRRPSRARIESVHDEPVRQRLYGEIAIAEAELEPLPNPAPDRDYLIELSSPEFTCLCPRSGYPDFATIHLRYVPDRLIVELKSVKLYLNRYRDEHAFHEAVINKILDDFVAAAQPRWIQVVGDFQVRGNIKTIITVEHRAPGYAGVVDRARLGEAR
jgi:7-cyano-7-deazaguanine reductase